MPRRKAKLDLTLFPFLSVLCGLIAVMVLFMIVTISTRVISNTAVPEPGGAPAAPGQNRPEEGIDGDDFRRLDARVQELEGVLAEKARARDELRRELDRLAALVEAKKRASDAAAARPAGVRLGEPTPVKMIPKRDPAAPNRTAVFIEVNSTGYVVHPVKTTFELLPAAGKGGGGKAARVPPGLAKLIEGMGRAGDRYPLLLVHPNGVEAFDAVLDFHTDLKRRSPGSDLNIGWEPFAREWLLDQN